MTALAPDRTRSVSRPAPSDRPAGVLDILRVRVELWIAVVCMALAFGAGLAVSLVGQPAPAPAVATSDIGAAFPFAPPLTDQQVQQGLPPGHPDLGSGGSGSKPGEGSKGSAKGSSKTISNDASSSGGTGSGG